MIQGELTPTYRLLYKAPSTLDLGYAGIYLLTRFGKDGRVSFVGPGAMQATLDKRERRNFLRFIQHHGLQDYLVYDDGRRIHAAKD